MEVLVPKPLWLKVSQDFILANVCADVVEGMETRPSSEKIAQYKERCAKHRRYVTYPPCVFQSGTNILFQRMQKNAGGGMWVVPLVRHFSKRQNQLGCLIAHLGNIGGVGNIIENAQHVYNNLLIPVQSVERALDWTGDGAWCSYELKLQIKQLLCSRETGFNV